MSDRDMIEMLIIRAQRAEAEVQRLRQAAHLLKTGDCWCGVGTGNPNYRGNHALSCKLMSEALQATESETKG